MITNTDKQFFGLAGVNYFRSPGIENGNLDFSLFSTTYVNNVPTTITPSAFDVFVLGQYGNALRGNFYLQAEFTGTNLGEGLISPILQIDSADLAKVLTISFEYRVVAGVFNASGTSTQSLEVWIYDVVNAVWIQPAGYRGMNQTSGSGRLQCTFQTASNSSQYRVALIVKNAVICTIIFDTFSFGPQSTVQGAAISDWVSYPSTPVITVATGTVPTFSSVTGRYRRVGDSVEVEVSAIWQTAAIFGTFYVGLPGSLKIDVSKLASQAGSVGNAYIRDAGVTNYAGTVRVIAGFDDRVEAQAFFTNTSDAGSASDPTIASGLTQVNPFTFASGDEVKAKFSVPISGWSSNTVLSQDTDTRVVAASYSISTANTPGASFGARTVVKYATKVADTHSAYDTSTGQYTVPVSGQYRITTQASFSHTEIVGNTYAIVIQTGSTGSAGTLQAEGLNFGVVATARRQTLSASTILSLNAGDTINIAAYDTNTSPSIQNSSSEGRLSIERLSGPATIAASETVSFSACESSTSIANGSLDVMKVITSATVLTDSHAAYNQSLGTYTIPVSGRYLINGNGAINSTLIHFRFGFSVDNLTNYTNLDQTYAETAGIIEPASFSSIIPLKAGQIIRFGASHGSATPQGMLNDSRFNFVNITRVGN